MLKHQKMAKDVEETEWLEIGGTLYQVEKKPETNDFGDKVLHLRPNASRSADVILIIRDTALMEIFTEQ